MTRDDLSRLARRRECPRCAGDKTMGTAICRRCRAKLPAHMRHDLEHITEHPPNSVMRAIRGAARYFDQHFRSIRQFGGGKKR